MLLGLDCWGSTHSSKNAYMILPSQRNVLMLGLLGSGMEDTLPTVDLHTNVQLKVDVPLGGRPTEAAVGGCAGPALAEELTHCREARGLPVGHVAGDTWTKVLNIIIVHHRPKKCFD